MKGSEYMLQIEHFSKTYDGKRRAVDDLTLHVAAGDLFGFLKKRKLFISIMRRSSPAHNERKRR